ncbi:uncharacterized protein LODBEIA_P35240 [Lodderomyces beijingensis]|uniref:Uncharacterized protein n=1 Tax=Lodderomyces beijingensis TaxID=1775926 RepID=A0ABP0ZSW3_9ASCO
MAASNHHTRRCSLAIASPGQNDSPNDPLNAFLLYSKNEGNNSQTTIDAQELQSQSQPLQQQQSREYSPFSHSINDFAVDTSDLYPPHLVSSPLIPPATAAAGAVGGGAAANPPTSSSSVPTVTKAASFPSMRSESPITHPHEFSACHRRISICDLNNFSDGIKQVRRHPTHHNHHHNHSVETTDHEAVKYGGHEWPELKNFSLDSPSASSSSTSPSERITEFNLEKKLTDPFATSSPCENPHASKSSLPRHMQERGPRNHRRRNSIALKFEEPRVF